MDRRDDELATMKAWGVTPDQWRERSLDDRADMMAHELIMGLRSAWQMEQSEVKAGSGEQGAGKSGMAEFKRMKEMMARKG